MDEENFSTNGVSKKGKSLSLRLSLSQVWQQIGSYIRLDLFITLLFAICLVIWGEYLAEQTYSTYMAKDKSLVITEDFVPLTSEYLSVKESNTGEGLRVLTFMENWGMVRNNSYRQFNLQNSVSRIDVFEGEFQRFPAYQVSIPTEKGTFFQVTIFWENPIIFFSSAMFVLIIYQILSIPFSIIKARRKIRRALEPIYQLTATAQTISGAPDLTIPLSGTIDALNTITSTHMDLRIPISDEREELQGLAQAINEMLDRLDASYKAQLQFVSDASHELRTPISIIQGYARLIARWGKDDPTTLQESIDAIQSETVSMQTLVEQLLFLARSDNRSLQIYPVTTNISELMQEVLEETKMINEQHTMVDNIKPNIFIVADPQLVKQAIRILVDNSIKYTPSENGRITLGLEEKNGNVYINVSDNGVGISSDNLTQLFNRFWRADSSRARQTGGTGLGLSIAKWISESHGGYINVVSRQDLGSKFSIILPMSTNPEIISDMEKPVDKTTQKAKLDISEKEIDEYIAAPVLEMPTVEPTPQAFAEFSEIPSLASKMKESTFSTKDL